MSYENRSQTLGKARAGLLRWPFHNGSGRSFLGQIGSGRQPCDLSCERDKQHNRARAGRVHDRYILPVYCCGVHHPAARLQGGYAASDRGLVLLWAARDAGYKAARVHSRAAELYHAPGFPAVQRAARRAGRHALSCAADPADAGRGPVARGVEKNGVPRRDQQDHNRLLHGRRLRGRLANLFPQTGRRARGHGHLCADSRLRDEAHAAPVPARPATLRWARDQARPRHRRGPRRRVGAQDGDLHRARVWLRRV